MMHAFTACLHLSSGSLVPRLSPFADTPSTFHKNSKNSVLVASEFKIISQGGRAWERGQSSGIMHLYIAFVQLSSITEILVLESTETLHIIQKYLPCFHMYIHTTFQ